MIDGSVSQARLFDVINLLLWPGCIFSVPTHHDATTVFTSEFDDSDILTFDEVFFLPECLMQEVTASVVSSHPSAKVLILISKSHPSI